MELRPFTNENGSKEIWVQGRSRETVQHWAGLIDDFLQRKWREISKIWNLTHECLAYRSQNASADSTIHQCGNNPPPENGVCEVDVSSFGPCNPQSHYGYTDSPCIFLRLNNVSRKKMCRQLVPMTVLGAQRMDARVLQWFLHPRKNALRFETPYLEGKTKGKRN